MKITGQVFNFGDNIDTDQIYPGRYLELTDHTDIARHAMEGVDPDFVNQLKQGDFILAGRNFGCGSSREHAVITLKKAGVGAIIATSFARIFYRNAINMGLPVIECPDCDLAEGEEITINLTEGIITGDRGKRFSFVPLPDNILKIIEAGGIINLKKAER